MKQKLADFSFHTREIQLNHRYRFRGNSQRSSDYQSFTSSMTNLKWMINHQMYSSHKTGKPEHGSLIGLQILKRHSVHDSIQELQHKVDQLLRECRKLSIHSFSWSDHPNRWQSASSAFSGTFILRGVARAHSEVLPFPGNANDRQLPFSFLGCVARTAASFLEFQSLNREMIRLSIQKLEVIQFGEFGFQHCE